MALFPWIKKPSAGPEGKQAERPHLDLPHYERDYNQLVDRLIATHPYDEAMSWAVGGCGEMGSRQVELPAERGVRDGMSLVDLGCGSGRTAIKIAKCFPNIDYVGIDVVDKFPDHAKSKCPAQLRFIKSAELGFSASKQYGGCRACIERIHPPSAF